LTALLAAAVAMAIAGGPVGRLEATVAPQRALPQRTSVTLGYSAQRRPIRAWAVNGLNRRGPLILVFGCIHGDECAGTDVLDRLRHNCPPRGAGLVAVKNLDPDGFALGTRLNSNGVDLNRNFGYDWRQIGVPGDPEHSGYYPFSEPESWTARKLIRELRPDITIWFHQQAEPLVRAWGQSIPAARRYARLAGSPFVPMPWMDGTAPNWQNHVFPGTASFVVELPADGDVRAAAHARALLELGRRG
jgi:protein MpaA